MGETLKVEVLGKTREVQKGTTFEELSKAIETEFPYLVVLARQDNRLCELSSVIKKELPITFMDLREMDAVRTYQRSISFLMIKAVKEILGKTAIVNIEHSIHKSLYCEVHGNGIIVDLELLNKISEKMKQLVEKDIKITKKTFSREDAIAKVSEFGMLDKVRLFQYRRSSNINLYEMDGFFDYFYGYMVPSTKYLENFSLSLYENGFLIHFPSRSNPNELLTFVNHAKISSVFMEQVQWCFLMGVNNVADLNDVISHGKFGDLVRINEALHEKKIVEIVEKISGKIKDVKVVLIAGPSSSGKTTFANRLCVQLRVNGIMPHTISLDNYFINRENTPLDESGNKDFENIDALDLDQLNDDLSRLIAGEKVEIPSYNFITGKREYNGNVKQLKEGEIFVIEGIHGLNDLLTKDIPIENKFKIFISAMTGLNIDDHNRIATTDSRLIRRIVRDNQFRARNAADTISAWNSVTRGEEKNIFPFQENADVIFNSATIYELSVLKQYIEPLLFNITKNSPEYIDAKRLVKFMDYFLGANDRDIPNNSIIKEFLGGSCFTL